MERCLDCNKKIKVKCKLNMKYDLYNNIQKKETSLNTVSVREIGLAVVSNLSLHLSILLKIHFLQWIGISSIIFMEERGIQRKNL